MFCLYYCAALPLRAETLGEDVHLISASSSILPK